MFLDEFRDYHTAILHKDTCLKSVFNAFYSCLIAFLTNPETHMYLIRGKCHNYSCVYQTILLLLLSSCVHTL